MCPAARNSSDPNGLLVHDTPGCAARPEERARRRAFCTSATPWLRSAAAISSAASPSQAAQE